MAGDTVVSLKELLPMLRFIAHRISMRGSRAAGVDRGRIHHEGDAQCAEDSSIVDFAVPRLGKLQAQLIFQFIRAAAKIGLKNSSNINRTRILFEKNVILTNKRSAKWIKKTN